MKIYLDFDGTVVEHAYPQIGNLNPGSFETMQKLQSAGHELILNTYRTDLKDGSFNNAIKFLNFNKKFKIKPILKRTRSKINPPDWNLEDFIKKQTIFIDDISKGIPLIKNIALEFGKMVDWAELDKQFVEKMIY